MATELATIPTEPEQPKVKTQAELNIERYAEIYKICDDKAINISPFFSMSERRELALAFFNRFFDDQHKLRRGGAGDKTQEVIALLQEVIGRRGNF